MNTQPYSCKTGRNSIPNYKTLDRTKLEVCADDKFSVNVMNLVTFDRVENIVGKGDNAGYQHCVLFPQCFLQFFPSRSLELKIFSKLVNSVSKNV